MATLTTNPRTITVLNRLSPPRRAAAATPAAPRGAGFWMTLLRALAAASA
jgi:hypothetical protein